MQTSATRTVRIPVPEKAPPAQSVVRTPTVLLVTDDEDLRQAAARALSGAGYRVLLARHAGHALLTCLAETGVDVLVAELSMPEGSGPALSNKLRRHQPDLKSLYLARPGAVGEVDTVLVRPFTRDDLVSRVVSTLSRPG